MTACFGKAHGLPVNINDNGTASISGLLDISGPSAILRIIALAIVNTLNGMTTSWLLPHVGKKCSKVLPPITNRYSSSSIAFKAPPIRVVASSQHGRPASIFAGCASIWRMPVLCQCFTYAFSPQASTTLSESRNEASCSDGFIDSAITSAQPLYRGSHRSLASYNDKTIESLTRSVFELSHKCNVAYYLRTYKCPYCGESFTHAKAREHWEVKCPKKNKR